MKSERPTGVLLTRLPADMNIDHPGDCALGIDDDGTCYVVCTEGVGWEVKHEGFTFSDYNPVAKVWSSDELLEAAMDGDTVDLSDWVRSFGARLESNFWLWYRKLGGA